MPLVVTGCKDRCTSDSHAERPFTMLPLPCHHIVRLCGHTLHEEEPLRQRTVKHCGYRIRLQICVLYLMLFPTVGLNCVWPEHLWLFALFMLFGFRCGCLHLLSFWICLCCIADLSVKPAWINDAGGLNPSYRICNHDAFSGILLSSSTDCLPVEQTWAECDFEQNDTEMWIRRRKICASALMSWSRTWKVLRWSDWNINSLIEIAILECYFGI